MSIYSLSLRFLPQCLCISPLTLSLSLFFVCLCLFYLNIFTSLLRSCLSPCLCSSLYPPLSLFLSFVHVCLSTYLNYISDPSFFLRCHISFFF
uniref:Uncharacterized protein n=1 Tax=Arundo donax TaxID=35708 RepID=A0A0A9DLB4_ARUDO